MANPDSLFNGQGETLDPIYGPDGTVYLKASGAVINVDGATDDAAAQLVQDYPGQYTLTPTGLALAQGAGTLAAATYFYRVSATTAAGETLACAEVGLAIGATTGVILTWDAMPGATGYRVYGRATGAQLFIAAVGGTTLTYTDSGALTPSGALPTVSTARIGQVVEGALAAAATLAGNPVLVGGSDSAFVRIMRTDTGGRVVVVGPTLDGAFAQYTPVQVAGQDGTNVQSLLTDTSGRLITANGASTGTTSDVASSASSVSLLAANAARRGATITNESTAVLYVKLMAAAASLTSYTVTLAGAAAAPYAYYEVPFGYTGEIRGIWASADGNARITEIT